MVEAEMRRIESVMSSYIEGSELSAVNRLSAYQPLILTSELYQLIQKSLYFSALMPTPIGPDAHGHDVRRLEGASWLDLTC